MGTSVPSHDVRGTMQPSGRVPSVLQKEHVTEQRWEVGEGEAAKSSGASMPTLCAGKTQVKSATPAALPSPSPELMAWDRVADRGPGTKAGRLQVTSHQWCENAGVRAGAKGLTSWQYPRSEILHDTMNCALNHLVWQRSINWAGRRRARRRGMCWLNPGKSHEGLKERRVA